MQKIVPEMLLEELCVLEIECAYIYLFGMARELHAIERFSDGLHWQTLAPFRSIFASAFRHDAKAILIAHNHPGGIARPSQSDCNFTRKLSQLSCALDIELIDHLIVAGKDRFSFRAEGML